MDHYESLRALYQRFDNVPSNARTGVFRIWTAVAVLWVVGWTITFGVMLIVQANSYYGLAGIGSTPWWGWLLLLSFILLPPYALYAMGWLGLWIADGFGQKSERPQHGK